MSEKNSTSQSSDVVNTLSVLPSADINFPGRRPNEHVVLLMRRHWLVLAKYVFYFSVLSIIPVVIAFFLSNVVQFSLPRTGALYVVLVVGLSTYYLFIWVLFFHDFIDYHLDIWVLTNERIVSIEQLGLFHRIISELSIAKVQDVTSEVHGLIPTFFNYGEVHIQTAGSEKRFVFREISKPREVAQIILHVHEQVEAAMMNVANEQDS